jgi:hypothetical protein
MISIQVVLLLLRKQHPKPKRLKTPKQLEFLSLYIINICKATMPFFKNLRQFHAILKDWVGGRSFFLVVGLFGTAAMQVYCTLTPTPPNEFHHSTPEALHTKCRDRPLLAKDGTKTKE